MKKNRKYNPLRFIFVHSNLVRGQDKEKILSHLKPANKEAAWIRQYQNLLFRK